MSRRLLVVGTLTPGCDAIATVRPDGTVYGVRNVEMWTPDPAVLRIERRSRRRFLFQLATEATTGVRR